MSNSRKNEEGCHEQSEPVIKRKKKPNVFTFDQVDTDLTNYEEISEFQRREADKIRREWVKPKDAPGYYQLFFYRKKPIEDYVQEHLNRLLQKPDLGRYNLPQIKLTLPPKINKK